MFVRCVLLSVALLGAVMTARSTPCSAADDLGLVPRPVRVDCPVGAAPCILGPAARIATVGAAADLGAVTRYLATEVHATTGVVMDTGGSGEPAVTLEVSQSGRRPETGQTPTGDEGYLLRCDAHGVHIAANTPRGAFYGVQTLLQLLRPDGNGRATVPAITVVDHPRFGWRGLHLDVSRHFLDKAAVERFIDLMARHKFNVFHWHLTDDEGWRIAIRKYPRLTEIGAWRASSPTPGWKGTGDGRRYGGFYTQDDIREVVAYAADRFITVLPEIEMPGHAAAAIASYPEYGNTDVAFYSPAVQGHWGVHPYTFAPREETFGFLFDILDEVCDLFPGAYVHVGGDEAPKYQWEHSAAARAVMQAHGLQDGEALQAWFMQRIEAHLRTRGKKLIGWDEIQEGGLSPTATMMVWREWKYAVAAIRRGNNVIMAPTSHTYLDYSPGSHPDGPEYETIGGHLPLDKVYAFEPIPAQVTPDQQRQVLGCQAQLWSEYLFNEAKVQYMAYPRACALAEVAWSPKAARDWKDFQARLEVHLRRLDRLGVDYRRADGTPARGGL